MLVKVNYMYIVEKDIRARLKQNGASKKQYDKSVSNIANMYHQISGRFSKVRILDNIQKKHVEWILYQFIHVRELKPSTMGDYKRDIRRLSDMIHKPSIADVLDEKDPKKGGRPTEIRARKTKKRHN